MSKLLHKKNKNKNKNGKCKDVLFFKTTFQKFVIRYVFSPWFIGHLLQGTRPKL